MKTILIAIEGAADRPLEALDGRTPLEVVRAPALSKLAASGRCGLIAPVGDGMADRTEVMLAALCGRTLNQVMDIRRGPVEACGTDVDLGSYTHAFSGSFVTQDGGIMRDTHVWRLSREETLSLAEACQATWNERDVKIAMLDSGRVVVLARLDADEVTAGVPPSTIKGLRVEEYLPRVKGKKADTLSEIARKTAEVLAAHTINEVRVDLGENPANALWLWGGGRIADLPSDIIAESDRGHMITRSPMAKGIARLQGLCVSSMGDPFADTSGMSVINLPVAIEAMRNHDVLVVYVEAPKELGFYGGLEDKLRALERLDHNVVEPVVELMEACKPYRVVVTSVGTVSTETRRPESEPLPVLLAGSGVVADDVERWDEIHCAKGSLGTIHADDVQSLWRKE